VTARIVSEGRSCPACGFRLGHAIGCPSFPIQDPDGCCLCGSRIPVNEPRWLRDPDGAPVCRWCIRGYVRCQHAYAPGGVCWKCNPPGPGGASSSGAQSPEGGIQA